MNALGRRAAVVVLLAGCVAAVVWMFHGQAADGAAAAKATRPSEVHRKDRQCAILGGFLGGILGGLLGGLAVGVLGGLAIGLVVGLAGGKGPTLGLARVELVWTLRGSPVRFIPLLQTALQTQVLRQSGAAAMAALAEEFPWLELLPRAELPQFVADFTRSAQIAAEVGQWSVLAQTVREWRATAAVYADPALLRQLAGPLSDDFGPVPGPVEAPSDAE